MSISVQLISLLLFSLKVEFIIRRIPFGRVYAIRREMDGQCLGIIRDGNTATIVDIVPNSLVARNGLPPKVCLDNITFVRKIILHFFSLHPMTGKIM